MHMHRGGASGGSGGHGPPETVRFPVANNCVKKRLV